MMSDVIHDAPAFVANGASWYEASARQRIDGLLDAGSFSEFLGPAERVTSPVSPGTDRQPSSHSRVPDFSENTGLMSTIGASPDGVSRCAPSSALAS